MGGTTSRTLNPRDIVTLYLNIRDPQYSQAASRFERIGDANSAALCWLGAGRVDHALRVNGHLNSATMNLIHAAANGKAEEIAGAVARYRMSWTVSPWQNILLQRLAPSV